jgi:hypothetical protein
VFLGCKKYWLTAKHWPLTSVIQLKHLFSTVLHQTLERASWLWSYHCECESRSGEVCSIQHYVIKFVSDLWQEGGFLQVLWFPPPIKTDRHDITEILLKVALNIITLTHWHSVKDAPFFNRYALYYGLKSTKNWYLVMDTPRIS